MQFYWYLHVILSLSSPAQSQGTHPGSGLPHFRLPFRTDVYCFMKGRCPGIIFYLLFGLCFTTKLCFLNYALQQLCFSHLKKNFSDGAYKRKLFYHSAKQRVQVKTSQYGLKKNNKKKTQLLWNGSWSIISGAEKAFKWVEGVVWKRQTLWAHRRSTHSS